VFVDGTRKMEDGEATWEVVPGRLGTRRQDHTAVVHGGTICAVGGAFSLDAVEAYDITTQEWHKLAGGSMSEPRKLSTAAVYKGKLYVVGGQHDGRNGMLRSVEVYNFATQQWSLLPTELSVGRCGHGAVVCEDKLYIIGGEGAMWMHGGNATRNHLTCVEVYDFVSSTWSVLTTTLPQIRAWYVSRFLTGFLHHWFSHLLASVCSLHCSLEASMRATNAIHLGRSLSYCLTL
jgi:N-acetylneuraminic acid mutarotase